MLGGSISSPAIDEASRYRVLKIYAQSSIPNAIAFIDEVRRRLPVAIHRVQTDHGNGSERISRDISVLSGLPIDTSLPGAQRAMAKWSVVIELTRKSSTDAQPSEPSASSPPSFGSGSTSTTIGDHISLLPGKRRRNVSASCEFAGDLFRQWLD